VKLVVDANIVFSGLLNSDGVVGDVFYNSRPPLDLYAPELLREEIAEHRTKLVKLSKRSSDIMLELELFALSWITFFKRRAHLDHQLGQGTRGDDRFGF
jgi:predicted nucleic acid-binding protein